MRRTRVHLSLDRKWLMPLGTAFLLSLLVILLKFTPFQERSYPRTDLSSQNSKFTNGYSENELPRVPKFAYLITGTKGEGARLRRILQAVYHPRNYYLLHLDLEAGDNERIDLAKYVRTVAVMREFENVMVVGKANSVTYKGPTMIACTLHAVAILLKKATDWDWFINLSSADYPLMSQDDLLHIFSYLPRDLNFLDHTSNIGWKEVERARPIIIDPGLYQLKTAGVYWANEKRSMPASFKLFTGSGLVGLTRSFLEFCVWGWDNLPRTLLMYYTNFLSSSEGYFHTVICNHKDYQNTTVNYDLHFTKWDNPPKQHPLTLTLDHFGDMVQSGAPFARKFAENDPVLKKIDEELLRRVEDRVTPGGWCIGNSIHGNDPCAIHGRSDAIKPTVSSTRLEKLIVKLLASETFRPKQCK